MSKSVFVCPLCGKALERDGIVLRCEKGHCFDLSKHGYANLLMSQKSSEKRHGDDRLMARARGEFLDSGWYDCLLDNLVLKVCGRAEKGSVIVDAGCGECFYTARINLALEERGIAAAMCGIDISRDALICASKRKGVPMLAVASAFDMPIASNSADIVINIFAPCAQAEFSRILKDDGLLIRAVPLERHLWGLKAMIYERPYENVVAPHVLEGFSLIEKQELRQTLHLSSPLDIERLFKMTPYYYKTSVADQAKLALQAELETEVEFCILTYKKGEKHEKK
ncbi:MAG: methyltransferase domain-containing protein [Oscillospiraceae bacterium]